MPSRAPRFKDALGVLAHHRVEFIVVGGVAGVLGGAPVSTFDLDIVQERSDENVARLMHALVALDARYRDPGGRILVPTPDVLLGPGHYLLITNCGPLDVLGQIGRHEAYADLLNDTEEVRIGEHRIRVLGLARLIRTKEQAGREKDRAVLAILRRTLAERGRT